MATDSEKERYKNLLVKDKAKAQQKKQSTAPSPVRQLVNQPHLSPSNSNSNTGINSPNDLNNNNNNNNNNQPILNSKSSPFNPSLRQSPALIP